VVGIARAIQPMTVGSEVFNRIEGAVLLSAYLAYTALSGQYCFRIS